MNATLAGIEELDLFPTPEDRERAIAAHAESIRGWDLVLGIVVCIVAALASWVIGRWGVLGGLSYVLPWPVPGWLREVVPFATVAGGMFLTLRVLHRWGVRRDLRSKLIVLGVPVCVKCGYLLRGLDPGKNQHCPECGRALDDGIRALLAPNAAATPGPSNPSSLP